MHVHRDKVIHDLLGVVACNVEEKQVSVHGVDVRISLKFKFIFKTFITKLQCTADMLLLGLILLSQVLLKLLLLLLVLC